MDEEEELEPGTTNDDETAFRCECCRQTFDSDEYYSLETCNDGGLGVVLCGPCCAFADGLLARSTKFGDQHPTQPVQRDEHGVTRFKRNEIVRWLLDEGPFDMNTIAMRRFPTEDQRQFAQLIGYSVGGYQELSYATAIDVEPVDQADDVVAAMYAWADEMEAKPGDVGTFIAAEIRRRVREASDTAVHDNSEAREVLRTMIRAAKADAAECERHQDRGRAAFCDGGATRLKFAAERLRAALGISPAEYEEMEAEE